MTKAWNKLEEVDLAVFVVDSVKKLDFNVKHATIRLANMRIDYQTKRVMDALRDKSFDIKRYKEDFMNHESDSMIDTRIPSILVMNKVDLVTNRKKFKFLQHEL